MAEAGVREEVMEGEVMEEEMAKAASVAEMVGVETGEVKWGLEEGAMEA